MFHRFRSMFVVLAQALCVCAILCWSAAPARGQSLAFTPGLAGTYAGDPTQSHGPSSASYTGPLNNWSNNYQNGTGLVMTTPTEVAFDSNGNVYDVERILNSGYSYVVRVFASGKGAIPAVPGAGSSPQAGYVYPAAGNGTQALSSTCATATDTYGNGCAATDVDFQNAGAPPHIAIDASGNIYIMDTFANEIRVIYGGGSIPGLPANPVPGHIYALAGNGTAGSSGDGGPALGAELSTPDGVAVDGHGNIYFSEAGNDIVRVVYAGGSVPGLPSSPTAGNLYTIAGTVGSTCNYGSSTCGDEGPATAAQFGFYIGSVGVDPSGNIYIADTNNTRVRAIYAAGTLPGISSPTVGDIYTIAGAGSLSGSATPGVQATNFKLKAPAYLAFDPAGDVYISDGQSDEVYKVDSGGILTLVFGGGTGCATQTYTNGDGCAANAATLNAPTGIALDSSGNLYVADQQSNVIREADTALTALVFTGTYGLTVPSQVLTLSNTGIQPLQLSDIFVQAPFAQADTGGSTDCGNSTLIAPGASCQIGISVTPTQAGTTAGSLQVSSNSLNASSGQNVAALMANIAHAASSTVLTASPAVPAQVSPGQPVTFTATVLPQTGVATIPTGTVNFNNGATTIGSATVNGSGVATFTTSSLAAGSYVVTAAYAGDTNFNTSNSNAAFVTVASAAVPTVTLTASPTSTTAGQSVTLTATVTPPGGGAAPTGTIIFKNGVAPISSAISLDGSGTATFSTASLPAGNNTLFATYSGNLPANGSNAVVVTVAANAQLQFTPGVISAIAGDYDSGYTGDGGAATSAELQSPQGMAYDSAGNLYFADMSSGVVRVVASGKGTIPGVASPVAGNIYTVAGVQGQKCSTSSLPCGDGGPADQAFLNFGTYGPSPAGVAVDLAGNLYIADVGDFAIRKVTPDGTISTVAGKLSPLSFTTATGDGGPATSATLSGTVPDIAVDQAGNLYLIDSATIRKVDAQTQIITTVAGSAASGFLGDGGAATAAALSQPSAIALDDQGNLYIADPNNEVVREVNAQTGIISTVAGYHYNAALLRCAYGTNVCFNCDGGPATQAQLYDPAGISVDAAGNLYINDSDNYVVRMVDAQTGIINTIAGQPGQYCYFAAPCGDGELATTATFGGATYLALDSAGNLDVADSYVNTIRQISAATTALNFGSQNLGTTTTQTFTVTNTGASPLIFTGITTTDGFQQQASGGTDCSASSSLAPGAQCQVAVAFFPLTAGAVSGSLTITSNSTNASNGNNTITLSGTGVGFGGTEPQTITFPALHGPFSYGQQVPLSASSSIPSLPILYGVSGPGIILNNGAQNAALKITGTGSITITAYQVGNSQYAAAASAPQTIQVNGAPLQVIAPQSLSIIVGQPIPQLTYTVSGLVNGDTQSVLSGQPALTVVDGQGNVYPVGSTPPTGHYTITIAQGTLHAPGYYMLTFVPGNLQVTGNKPQTIAFTAPPANVTYGVSPIPLTAVAVDANTGQPINNLQVSFSATPASLATVVGQSLTITGAGTVAVTANQPGNDDYAAAQPVTDTIQVAKAPLTVQASDVTVVQGVPIPPLNLYTANGFVNGESLTALTGLPVLTTTATQGSPVGQYPITITQGTLSSNNYAFNFVNGTLTIKNGQAQTINFPALPNVTYGAAPITLNASASSTLGITYKVAGPAQISGNVLTITGAGTITVTATQNGNDTYAPASATQSFTVGPALLTVTAANVTRVNNVQNPPLTGYTISGFVNGDTQAVVSGTPAISTTALPGSPVGTYPIVITQQPKNSAQNPMASANYTFAFVNGTLTITPGGPTPDFSLTAAPSVLGIPQGQLQQTTITLSPTNYYQGTVKLTCGNLPKNMSCVFSPSALSADGTGNPVTGTLTINTNAGSPVVAQALPPSGRNIFPAAVFYLPGEFVALLVMLRRRRRTKNKSVRQLLILLLLLTGIATLTACGGGSFSSSSEYVAPGNYPISLSAADSAGGMSHSINLTIDVQ